MFPLLLLGAIGLQVWTWQRLIAGLRNRALTKLQCVLRYTAWTSLPLFLLVGIFLAMIGLEELFQVALVGERSALLVFPVFGIWIVGAIAFAARCAFARIAPSVTPPRS